jgi:hypothetical protein
MNADGSQCGEPIKTVLVPSREGELPIRDGLFPERGDHRFFFSTPLGR